MMPSTCEPDQEVTPSAEEHGEEVKLNLEPLGWVPVLCMTIGFVGLLAGLFYVGYVPAKERQAAITRESRELTDARPIVSVKRPYRAESLPELTLPGATRPFQETEVYPRASGYLKMRKADIGDRVTEGQLLAEIDIPDLQAQLTAARAKLSAAQATLGQARTRLEIAQITYNRSRALASGTISKQEIDEDQATYLAARGALASAEGTVKAEEAEIQRLETLVGFSKVAAPFSGVVTARNYDIGALLSSGTSGNNPAMFRIAQTDVLRVVIDVPQSYYDQISIGSEASFVVRNFPNQPFAGKIARTSGSVDPQTRTVRVEADFKNPDGQLLPGMYGQVRLELARKEMPLLIPTSALVFGASGVRVALVGTEGKLSFANITLGRDFGTEVEVLSGLEGDEQIVANPGERLEEGLAVRIADQKPAAADGKPAIQLPDSPPARKVAASGG